MTTALELSSDDSELMLRLQAGDDRALDELMTRWQIPLRRFLQRSTLNEQDALYLAQETFVRIYRHRDKYRPDAKFSTWLFSIGLNLCRDRARRARARPTVSMNEPAFTGASNQPSTSPSASPDEHLLTSEAALSVREAVANLPEPLKSTVLLCEFEELSQADAAAAMKCSTKAIETRLYRARALLRQSLAQFFSK